MKFVLLGVAFCLIFATQECKATSHVENEDAFLNIYQLGNKYGYKIVPHKIITRDGYIITIHHIAKGRLENVTPKSTPVLIQHGLFASSIDWILNGINSSLAYTLVDLGYDVWMPNFRGNEYSRNHTTLNPDTDSSFWQFSWNEMGLNDLPASIDYILKRTKQKQLFYIGHSQGNTAFYVMASEKPQYNAKIKAQFSLAPVAYMNHMQSPLIKYLAPFTDFLTPIAAMIGLNEFRPSMELIKLLGVNICNNNEIVKSLCTNVMFLALGFNKNELNEALLPVILGHCPSPISTTQLVHYGQEITSGKFRKFDYGLIKNFFKYRSIHPPEYPIERITAPVYLLYSLNDWFASDIDVLRLYKRLRNAKEKYLVPDKLWTHLDFVFGLHANTVINDKVINWMKQYE